MTARSRTGDATEARYLLVLPVGERLDRQLVPVWGGRQVLQRRGDRQLERSVIGRDHLLDADGVVGVGELARSPARLVERPVEPVELDLVEPLVAPEERPERAPALVVGAFPSPNFSHQSWS